MSIISMTYPNLVPRVTCKGPCQDGGQIKNGGGRSLTLIQILTNPNPNPNRSSVDCI